MLSTLRKMKKFFKLAQKKRIWNKKNSHNFTHIIQDCDIDRIEVGNKTYGNLLVLCPGVDGVLRIGSYCSIADGVVFILSSDHPTQNVSTYPFKVKICHYRKEAISKGDILVDDDVWIGYGVKIMSGVHIGQGAVIAAGTVVTKDVPPYAIVGGVPGKIIKYRFSEEIIKYMITLDYQRLEDNLLKAHINDLYTSLSDFSLKEIMEKFEWFPKKEQN